MSIVLEKGGSLVGAAGIVRGVSCIPVFDGMDAGDGRSPAMRKLMAAVGQQDEASSCSSSIGRNSDSSSRSPGSDGEEDAGEAEVQSAPKGPLDTTDALLEALPLSNMRRQTGMRRTKVADIDTRDWAEGLPPELLGCILDHVTAQGHARFSTVCTSGRSAVKEAVNTRRPPPPQLPWVFIWPPFQTRAQDWFTLVRPYDGKYHAVRSKLPPDFHWTRVAGVSPEGCVVLVNNNRLPELRAFNLLTGARLRLPPVRTIPKGYPKECAKVAMSSPGLGGAGPDAFMALLHNGERQLPRAIVVARAGDKKWSLLDTTVLPIIYDVVYHEGAFYVLGRTRPDDLHEEEQVCIAVVPCGGAGHHLSSPSEIMVVGPIQGCEIKRFLVWSASGDLLLVVSCPSNTFAVCRLDFVPDGEGGQKIERSVQLRDLGEHALVVGRECSMMVSTQQVPQLKRNCVYSTCNNFLTMYSLEDGSNAYEYVPYGSCIQAAWFFPNLI